jgi:hypothetical protein
MNTKFYYLQITSQIERQKSAGFQYKPGHFFVNLYKKNMPVI